MTIKALVYIEKSTFEYVNILHSLTKVSNLEINNFIYSENSLIDIEGFTQFSGSLVSAVQQLKCDAVITFGINNSFIDNMYKLQLLESRLYLILIPICINVESLVKLNEVTIYTCLPLRHLNRVWKAHKSLTKGDNILQYIEGSLAAPTLGCRLKFYNCHLDITINHFYRLSMVDVIQFISSRNLFKVQALSRVVEWEMREEHKNEKHLDDYSLIIGHFMLKESDVKASLTSKSGSTMLNPRTSLIKIRSSFMDPEKVCLRVEIKSSDGMFKIDDTKVTMQKEKGEGEDGTFWGSEMVKEGVETFLRHVEHARQQNAPRLVDLGNLSEDDMLVARTSLISTTEVVRLCRVLSTVDRACCSGHTTLVE